MLEKTYVDASSLNKGMFKNVVFFSIAEGGAMGTPGEIVVVNKAPEAYSMNCVFGDVKMRNIKEMFPVLGECRFGLFGYDSVVPDGWHYVNLGMGNHLIVADDVYDEFQKLTKDCKCEVEYYQAWEEAAQEIVGL